MFGHKDAHDQYLAQRVFTDRDDLAFAELFTRYSVRVERFLRSKLPSQIESGDMASEVFLRAWEYMTTNQVEFPRAFLFRLAKNMIIDFYRKKDNYPVNMGSDPLETLPARGDLLEDILRAADLQDVHTRLKKIKPEYQQILTFRFFDELEIDEIAHMLGKTEGTVRVLIHRAKKAFKNVL